MNLDNFIDNLDKQMDDIERKMLEKKPWYLKGETSANERPENALLAEHFEVQRHAIYKPSPMDETILLEFIKKGIKKQAFENVVFKIKKKEHISTPIEFGNTEKNSLVEDYENLYVKAKALEKVQDNPEREMLRREIVDLFDNLDALSSMHFVPRARVDGYNIITNKQALAMEEAGPSMSTIGDLLAPEEIFEPRGEPIKGASEVTATDRRRHRKKLMRIRAGQRERRLKLASKSNNRQVAMDHIVKLAHKPGSKIKIAK